MKNKKWSIILIIFTILLCLSSGFLIINILKLTNIENKLRLVIEIIITLFTLLYLMICIKRIKNYKKKKNILMLILAFIYIGISGFLNYNFQIMYDKLNNVTKNYKESSLCIVTMKDNKVNDISDISSGKIGTISDTTIDNGINLSKKIMEEEKLDNNLKSYDDYLSIIKALYDGTIKYAFLPESYANMFSMYDEYTDVADKTKIIYTKTVKTETESGTKDVNEPFTILLMGVDTLETSYNADTLLVVTFNPKTLSSTILSIPRDTYTTIACSGGKHKINSSGWYGDQCVVDTVSKYLDVEIDYYAKVNFNGIVQLVDSLGGIEVDVPYKFCEQNSKRQFGSNTIYLEKGLQTLNGEQALALSRNRHGWPQYCSSEWNTDGERSDFTRGQNQQLVLKAMLNKVSKIRNINTVYDLLDTLSKNIETNMDNDTILSFYNIAKDIVKKSDDVPFEEIINMQRLYFTSYTPTVRISGLPLSMVVNYDKSVKAIQKAMKQNLGLIKKDINLSYEFDINNPYKEELIGYGLTDSTKIVTLPDFIGSNVSTVQEFCNTYNLELTIEYKNISDGSASDGVVLSQTPESYTDVNRINKSTGMTIIVAKVEEVSSNNYDSCKTEKNQNNSICTIPTFTSQKEFDTWYNKIGSNFTKNIYKSEGTSFKVTTDAKNLYELYKGEKMNVTFVPTVIEDEEENTDTENSETKTDENKTNDTGNE